MSATDYIPTAPKPVLLDSAIYFDDVGRALCGRHAGMAARFTGYSRSGVRMHRVTEADVKEYAQATGKMVCCETCGQRADARAAGTN